MVWLNDRHINESVPNGTFGGAMCTCQECKKAKKEQKKSTLPKLKSCPFCGGEAKILLYQNQGRLLIKCTVCWAKTKHFDEEEMDDAIQAWNQRIK